MTIENVLISGAGIGGLSLATALGRRSIKADIVEIKPDDAVQGIGISVPINALKVLKSLDVIDDFLEVGLIFDSYRLFDADGELISSIPMPRERPDGLPSYVGIPRPAYSRILAAAALRGGASLKYGTSIEDMEEKPDAVDVRLTDGTEESYDVVVAADGVRSNLRRRLFGDGSEPLYSGAVAWRAPLPRPAEITYMASYQGVGTKPGFVPINETDMYLFLVIGEPDRRPDRDSFHDMLSGHLAQFDRGILADVREELPDSSQIVHTPFERVILPPPWHRGRVVLLGDAAHAMSANLSQGASSALEDSVVLAEELAGHDSVEDALTSYAERRYPRAKFVQDLSHEILVSEVCTEPDAVANLVEETKSAADKFRSLTSFLEAPI